ncbi:putative secreted protein [Wickerhamomyces ciferrii]|uniref:Secreted protein n=1 Tax=Wickerhamomyces ciferrii (strain ATCC 14091 / BCRC 22168 / CBS 111 / JCM 3599 / NBRC 0793 / NRRL Y-1031 F-60-10) TaxID=1206466 RepID=K0KLC7_WICCF|nr:uncharacterized protein BN7_3320 [Wickerhamomyces ciferrii]CCH43766.1 putative secreted protein [Wickerhamomyces ciferrii]
MFNKLLITLCLVLQLIPTIIAAPLAAPKLHKSNGKSVSMSLELPYNPLNGNSIMVQEDNLLVSQNSQYDLKSWFSAYFNSKGSFEVDTKLLTISQVGQLKLSTDKHVKSETSIEHDDEVQRHTFSIKNGYLNFNNIDIFTLCPAADNEGLYTIHLTYSKSASACNGKGSINNAKFKVHSGAGTVVEDFELPEFIFNQGRHVYF